MFSARSQSARVPFSRSLAGMLCRMLSVCLLLCSAGTVTAQQTLRPVLSAYTLQAGAVHTAETYLSPLKYSGPAFALDYERMQAMRFNPENWVMNLGGNLGMSISQNPAHNREMWNFNLQLSWGMARRWHLGPRLTVFAGGFTAADAGMFYNASNGNNPVAAKASWTIGAQAQLAYNFNLRRIPVCLRFKTQLPLAGMFFSPQYGELYYEIYLGNRKGLLRAAWPGNFVQWHNMLSADLRLGSAALRVGYAFKLESVCASHIVTRKISHMAVLGVTSEWIALSPFRHISAEDKIINALY